MPLPFLKKPNRSAGISVSVRTSSGSMAEESEGQEDQQDQGLKYAAHDLLMAVDNRDIEAISEALRSAFQILDSEPHEEGEHINDYDNEDQQ